VHEFDAPSGDYHSEAVWNVDNGYVNMELAGCSFAYRHHDMGWLRRGAWKSWFGGMVVFNRVAGFGFTSVYSATFSETLTPVDRPVGSVGRIWRSIIDEKDGTSNVLLQNGVVAPKALMNILFETAFIMGDVTSPSLYITASKWMKKWNSTVNIDNYLRVLTGSVEWVVQNHSRVKRDYRSNIRWWHSFASYIYCRCSRVVDYVRSPTTRRFLLPSPLDSLPARDKYISGVKGPPPSCENFVIDSVSDRLLEPRGVITIYNRVPSTEAPVVFHNDQYNILSSLTNRAYVDIRPYDEELVQRFERFLPLFWIELFPRVEQDFEPTAFHTWNARFPALARNRHLKVFNRGDAINKKNAQVRNCFLKQEVTFDSSKPPRLITGVSDELKVCIGPYLHKLSTVVGRMMLSDDRYCYAPGKTTVDIGNFYDHDLSAVGTDMSRFDSCVTTRHMRAMMSLYRHFRFPEALFPERFFLHSIGTSSFQWTSQYYYRKYATEFVTTRLRHERDWG
jgi:hypothetical protein